MSPLGPQTLSPCSPLWSSSLLGGNSVAESDGLPIAAGSWLPERFSLAGKQWEPQDFKGRCQLERQAHQEDTHRERHRLPKDKFSQLTQLCSCWGQEDSCARAKGPWALLQLAYQGLGARGPGTNRLQSQGLGWQIRAGPSPLFPRPTGTYKTLVPFGS